MKKVKIYVVSPKQKIPKMSKLLNKKGMWTLTEIVIMVFAALLVIGTFGFFDKLYAATVGQEDDGSIANFDKLYETTQELIESSSEKDYKLLNYFLGEDKNFIGFDTIWVDTKEIVDIRWLSNAWLNSDDLNAYKPFKCGNSACLCLYTDDWSPDDPAKREKGVLSCKSQVFSNKKVIFLSQQGTANGVPRTDVSNSLYMVFFGDNIKISRIYIEKVYDKTKDTYFIFVSKIDENNPNDPAMKRKTAIDNEKAAANKI